MFDSRCPRCKQVISTTDTVMFEGNLIVHHDCRRPAQLTPGERVLLFEYCRDHAIAECEQCNHSYRQHELACGIESGPLLCPGCRVDLTASIRSHLYVCALVPSDVRTRAKAARETAQRLIKQAQQLADHADVLIAEAETAMTRLREGVRGMLSGPSRRGNEDRRAG